MKSILLNIRFELSINNGFFNSFLLSENVILLVGGIKKS